MTSGCPPEVARGDSGLWTWLALVWLPELGPINPGHLPARFVLEADDYRTYLPPLPVGGVGDLRLSSRRPFAGLESSLHSAEQAG